MLMLEHSTDATHVLDVAADLFEAEPQRSNMVASALVPGIERNAMVLHDDARTIAAAIQWENGYTFTPVRHEHSSSTVSECHEALAAGIPEGVERLMGMGSDLAGVAGAWSERVGGGFEPISIFRLYALGDLRMPETSSNGRLRTVGTSSEEIEREVQWSIGFGEDTGLTMERDAAEATVRRAAGDQRLLAWEVEGEIVSRLLISVQRFGVVRIGGVYTPPEHRGRGHAAALTARVSELALARPGVRSMILNTQAVNPMTNRLYRRIGYRAIGEFLNLRLITT